MTDPFETVREALEFYAERDGMKNVRQALAALEKIKERYVPELPEGYFQNDLFTTDDDNYCAGIRRLGCATISGRGPTINSAVTNAIKAIGER